MTSKEKADAQGTGRCPEPCGKIRYESRSATVRGIALLKGKGRSTGKRMRAYRCETSPYWHATSWTARSAEWKREQERAAQDA